MASHSARLAEHERRARPILELWDAPWAGPPEGDPDELVSVLVTVAHNSVSSPFASPVMFLDSITRRKLPFDAEDAQILFELAERGAADGRGLGVLKIYLAAVDALGVEGREAELERAFAIVAAEQFYGVPDRNAVRARLVRLVKRGGGDISVVRLADDDWAPRVQHLLEQPGVGALLVHLSTATQSKPSARWLKELEPLQDEAVVRELLEAAAETEVRVLNEYEYGGHLYRELELFAETNAVAVKGAVWAAGKLDRGWAALLERVFATTAPHSTAVANACVKVLGALSDPEAVVVLSRLTATVKDRGYRKLIDKALAAAAARSGLSPSQLVERVVPDLGLDAGGRKEIAVEGWTARIEVDHATVHVRWAAPDGKEQAAAPKDVDTTAAKAEIRELRKELSVQRARLERLLSEGARWTYDDWRAHYVDHPLVGVLARRLLWRFDGEPRLGLDAPRAAETVELWHPVGADPNEVYERRRDLVERELHQPFKQVFREVYLLAPAERETEVYSNRFAGHVLHFPQTYALLKERGWRAPGLGPWDGGYEAETAREFPAQGLRAEWSLAYVEDSGMAGSIGQLATTDQVRFYPLEARSAPPVPLADVPLVVFSEAMRDVDLFVGVSSIAADPTWFDRGLETWQDYWWREAFAELGPTAVTRREVLVDLIPRLSIADRLELEDRFLVVRGDLRTYRIHLGSANVLMEPNDEYLCIIPASSSERPTSKVFLPFDDDARLNVILSKAFLLARDTKIKDRSITAQVRRGL